MKKLLFALLALLACPVALVAQTLYTGSVSTMVGSAYGPYTNDAVNYLITNNADATLTVTICEYSLEETIMGSLTLGEYTVSNLTFDESRGGYYRDYTNDGLTMHFRAEKNGTVSMDNDYTFEKKGGNILVTATENGFTIVNSFQPGVMPFQIVATAQVAPDAAAIEQIELDSPRNTICLFDLQGRPTSHRSGLSIEAGKVVLKK